MEREKQMPMLKLMLASMVMVPMGLVLYLPHPLSAAVFLSGLVTRFPLIDPGRLQRLFARL